MSIAQQKASKQTAVVSAAVNAFLAAGKMFLGSITGSAALFADGVHSLADLLSDVFTYLFLKISHNDADDTHPYGHGKFETFGALILSVILVVTAIEISWTAITAYRAGESTLSFGYLALAAAAVSIVANEGLFHYCYRVGKQAKSSIVIANAWHHRADGLSSVAALIGIGLSLMGYPVWDMIAAIVVSIMLVHVAWSLGRKAFDELVDAAVEPEIQQQIAELMQDCPGVLNVHSVRARRLGGKIFIDGHVEVNGYISVSEGHAIAEYVESELLHKIDDVQDVVVHIDVDDEDHLDCPVLPDRVFLTTLVQQAFRAATTAGDINADTITLHFVKNSIEADVFLPAGTHLTAEQLTTAKQQLEKPTGPFKAVRFHVALA